MELKSVSKHEEPLLDRKRIEAVMSFEKSTPSYAEITKKLAETLKSDESAIAIRRVTVGRIAIRRIVV